MNKTERFIIVLKIHWEVGGGTEKILQQKMVIGGFSVKSNLETSQINIFYSNKANEVVYLMFT